MHKQETLPKQVRLQATIPQSNKWDLEDVTTKAESLGVDKNTFILNAVETALSTDNLVHRYIQKQSEGMGISPWLVPQNIMIKRMADDEAYQEVFKDKVRTCIEFMHIAKGSDRTIVTGEILFKVLKDLFKEKYEERRAQEPERADDTKNEGFETIKQLMKANFNQDGEINV